MRADEKEREEYWKGVAAPLEAAYASGGTAALERMGGVKPLFLWNWKVKQYKALGKQLEAQPGNARMQEKRDKLLLEINDIGAWINGKQRAFDRLPLQGMPGKYQGKIAEHHKAKRPTVVDKLRQKGLSLRHAEAGGRKDGLNVTQGSETAKNREPDLDRG